MPGNPGCLGVRWHWTSPAASANRGSQSSRARGLQVSEWLVVGVRTGSAWPCGCKERNRLGRQAAPRDLCESCCCRRYAGLAPPAPPLHATPCTTRSPETGRPGRAPPVGPPNRDACTCNAPCTKQRRAHCGMFIYPHSVLAEVHVHGGLGVLLRGLLANHADAAVLAPQRKPGNVGESPGLVPVKHRQLPLTERCSLASSLTRDIVEWSCLGNTAVSQPPSAAAVMAS